HLVLDGALDDELRAEPAERGQAIGIGHSVEHDGVDLLDQPRAGGYSAVHGVPPSAVLRNFRFGDYAVFNFSSSLGTSPEDLVSRLDPHIGTRVRVPGGDPAADVALEVGHVGVRPTLDLLGCQL